MSSTLRPRFIFLQFLNPEISSLYQVDKKWTPQQLYRQWLRLSKYALLVSDQGLAIPASYLFEVKTIDRFLSDLHVVRTHGLLHYASSTPDLERYKTEKRSEYRDELPLFPRYAEEDDQDDTPDGELVWIPRVSRSASADIAAAWRRELETPRGLWEDLLRGRHSRQPRLPSLLESMVDAVPDKLEGRAFIYRFALPFLPFNPDLSEEARLKLLISKEYLKSYLYDIDAAILTDTPIGDLDCGIENCDPDGRLLKISWRSLADCFDTLGVRGQIEALGWRDLLRLRAQSIFHWLIELVLRCDNEGNSVFQKVSTLTRMRALQNRHTSRRAYDVVRDRLWKFHDSLHPIMYSYDWDKLTIGLTNGPIPRRRSVKSKQQAIAQPTLLKEMYDVGIVVALNEEFRELYRHLSAVDPIKDDETETYYYFFTFPGLPDSPPYSCVSVLAGDKGNVKAALVTHKLQSRWHVRTVVSVGIAGGLDADVKLGDVVAVSLADNYIEGSKAITASDPNNFEFVPSGEPFRPTSSLVEACKNYEFACHHEYLLWQEQCPQFLATIMPNDQIDALTKNNLLRVSPELKTGHMASGPTVGSSIHFKNWLKARDRSYLALDMETGGVLWAIYDAARSTDSIALRGISDFADERKKDLDNIGNGTVRQYAMHNALQVLWGLMKKGILPRSIS